MIDDERRAAEAEGCLVAHEDLAGWQLTRIATIVAWTRRELDTVADLIKQARSKDWGMQDRMYAARRARMHLVMVDTYLWDLRISVHEPEFDIDCAKSALTDWLEAKDRIKRSGGVSLEKPEGPGMAPTGRPDSRSPNRE